MAQDQTSRSDRRLAAVMFTDMVGYSSTAERDETLALELLNEHHKILRQIFPSFGGKEIKMTGDGFFVEFTSIVDAVNCAVAIQTTLFERNFSVDDERKLQIRIGLHLGDVLDYADDRFGNEVNIAARIEPFAKPGGICISQQVADQIGSKIDLSVQRLGRIRLKNLRDPMAVYRIVMPWEPKPGEFLRGIFGKKFAIKGPSTFQGGFLGLQVSAIVAVLGFVFVSLGHPIILSVDRGASRSLASESEPAVRQLLLPTEWQYAMGTDEDKETKWLPFDVKKSFSYADQLDGTYLMKLEFIGAGGFRHPAMLLGLIPDVHRVYLNGKFVGGSERFSDLSVYSFDPELIRPGEANTVIVKARTRHSFAPGLNLLPELPPQIGEFEDITRRATRNQLSFQLLRPIFLAISLLLAVASLCYYLIRRTDLKFLYFSSFLLLGSLCLTYYNTFVVASVSYPFYRFIKLAALGLSSFTLFSLYLNRRGLKRLEAANNFAALVVGAGAFIALVGTNLMPSQYINRYNTILEGFVAYSAVWLGLLALRGALKISRPLEIRSVTREQIFDVGLISVFGVIIALLTSSSLMNGEQGGIFGSYLLRARFKDVALIYPFVFALTVLSSAIADYTRKSTEISYKRRKDDLILGIANLSTDGKNMADTIEQIQRRVTEFLGAARSTIYVANENEKESEETPTLLKASYIQGPVGTKDRIKKVIQPTSGIIGYCLAQKSPIFVEDISRDPRFKDSLSGAEDGSPGYRSGSCMVFPLMVGSRLLGVITVADRLDGKAFTRDDFCLMHLIAKDLAFVVSHSRLQSIVLEDHKEDAIQIA